MGTIFSAYDIRGRVGETLTMEYAWTVGKAFAEWLQDLGPVAFVREGVTDDTIARGLAEGLMLQGRDVLDGGAGGKSTLVDMLVSRGAAGGVLLSHDQAQNIEIITLFDASGTNLSQDALQALNDLVDSGNFIPAAVKGSIR